MSLQTGFVGCHESGLNQLVKFVDKAMIIVQWARA